MIPNPANIPPSPTRPAGEQTTATSTVATQELLRQSIEAKDNAMKLLTSVQNVVGIAEIGRNECRGGRKIVRGAARTGDQLDIALSSREADDMAANHSAGAGDEKSHSPRSSKEYPASRSEITAVQCAQPFEELPQRAGPMRAFAAVATE